MISKTESGRVGYRKKYRVAGRVRVPAGHCLYLMVFVLGWARATTASTGLPRRMASLTRSSKSVLSPDLLIIEIHEFNDLRVA